MKFLLPVPKFVRFVSLSLCFTIFACQDPTKVHCTEQARTDEALPNACFGLVSPQSGQALSDFYAILSQERGLVRVGLRPNSDRRSGIISLRMLAKSDDRSRQMEFNVTQNGINSDGTAYYNVQIRGTARDGMQINGSLQKEIASMMETLKKMYTYLEAHPQQKEGFPSELTTPLLDLLTRQAWLIYDEPSLK